MTNADKSFSEKFMGYIKRFGEKINFDKNKWKILAYGIGIAVTAVLFSVLLAWAAAGSAVADITIIRAPVLAREDVKCEYLVGQVAEQKGFALKIGDDIVTDCKVELDTSTAGLKAARIYYEDGSNVYEGSYPVTVYAVRHISIQSYPTGVTADENGEPVIEGMEIWAELSSAPKQLPLQTEYPDWETTIVLSEADYSVKLESISGLGGNSVTILCGNCTATFVQIKVDDREFVLNSPARILNFENTDGSGETLMLLVTQTESNNSDGENGALGTYVFTDSEGKTEFLQFSYYINGWESHFTSSAFGEGVEEKQMGDSHYEMKYKGITFKAPHASWTGAILTL